MLNSPLLYLTWPPKGKKIWAASGCAGPTVTTEDRKEAVRSGVRHSMR
jgi:hypothetical protein